jgi:hypothetical protein
MSVDTISPLERLLQAHHLEWLLLHFGPGYHESLASLRDVFRRAADVARQRLSEEAPDFSDEMLWELHQRNPHKAAALLQAVSATQNPEMMVLAWRILQGADIHALSLTYQNRREFRLRAELSPASGETPDVYESTDIVDATLLRHLGITKVNGQPLFDGFYALRLERVDLSPRRE